MGKKGDPQQHRSEVDLTHRELTELKKEKENKRKKETT